MDPLSDVLSLLKPRTYTCGGFDLGGQWCIQFGRHEGIKCYAAVSGQCWLSVEGGSRPGVYRDGRLLPVAKRRPFRLASDLSMTPVNADAIFQLPLNGRIGSCNGGGDFFGVGGHFTLTGKHASILLEGEAARANPATEMPVRLHG